MSSLIFGAILLVVIIALLAAYQTGRQLGYDAGRREGGVAGYQHGRADERSVLAADHEMPIEPQTIRRA